MKKYAICRHGNKISVKRTDRNYDFGEVINELDTLQEALLCAKVERMVLKLNLSNAPRDGRRSRTLDGVVGGKVNR